MTSNKKAASFEEIIHNARLRRRQQALIDKSFGSARRSSAPNSKPASRRGSPALGSLASRVEKRAPSTGIRKPGNLAPSQPRPRPSNIRRTREGRMLSGFLSENDVTPGLNIKGRASGPCVVTASNFAPGTTAEDIESAFEPVGGTILSCQLTSKFPSVIADIVFADKRGANNVVTKFNTQKADGRILEVQIEPGVVPPQYNNNPDINTGRPGKVRSPFDDSRELADRERENRRANPEIQDGRYGFDERPRLRHDGVPTGPRGNRDLFTRTDRQRTRNGLNSNAKSSDLYSDEMMLDQPHNGFQNARKGYR